MNNFFYSPRILMIMLSFVACAQAQDTRSWSDVFAQARDKAVQVIAVGRPYDWLAPFVKTDEQGGSGSGFIATPHGDIYTNFHVVNGAEVIYIQHPLAWKERFEVEFLGGSPEYDCAHLRLKSHELARLKALLPSGTIEYFELGDSDKLALGEKIMILGYPLGDENIKHAVGTISGQEPTRWGECLTTTAGINFGNSGGACIDKNGCVVAMVVGGVTNAEGIGYLIPVTRLKTIFDELIDGKVLHSPVWGWRLVSTTPQTLDYLAADAGVYVAHVHSGFLADSAGITKGDVISEINGLPVDRFGYVKVPWTKYRVIYSDVLARIKNGDTVDFTVCRKGEKIVCSVVKTAESPLKIKKINPPFDQEPVYDVFGGMVIMELATNHLELFKSKAHEYLEYGIYLSAMRFLDESNRTEPRLIITHMFSESDLAKNEVFNVTDRIVSKVNGLDVRTIEDFHYAVLAGVESGYVVVETERGGLAALPLGEILPQEPYLAEKYGYPLSPLFFQLVPDDILEQMGFSVDLEPITQNI